tara:strand:+ start:14353 stop:15090 length:738 start_codon:yes stop_codon:yes gene_type:complete
MGVFGVSWVEAIQEQAQSIANKKNIPDRLFHCLSVYVFDEQIIGWQTLDEKRIFTDEKNGKQYYERIEYHRILKSMPQGDYLYLWAEIYALATALLTEELSINSQHIIYRELEVKRTEAEVNWSRSMKPRTSKHNEALQEVIDLICEKIKPDSGVFGQTKLTKWLLNNLRECKRKPENECFLELISNVDCDELTYIVGIGESADRENGEFEHDALTWIDRTGAKQSISISSLKPYFKKYKEKMGS